MLHWLQIIVVIFFSTANVYSQSFVYSKNYFRWPVNIKPGIVANFGELRAGHWHMGLDIRTNHKINMPVYAAADGYIAKISINASGYGLAIYINHPNGLTTVYGHLNRFFPRLDSLVKAAQYKNESWEIELEFAREQFPVRKGQLIAYSGSTGSSEGPHVHFEIRDTKTNRCMNPLFFDLPVDDKVPPVFTKLAMYNRELSVYDQHAVLFNVKKMKNGYLVADGKIIKTAFSDPGFSIGAYDCVSGSANPNGIYRAKIFLDKKPVLEFVLDSMDYNETKYVDAHVDYPYHYYTGLYLQQLFKLPGDRGRAYHLLAANGATHLPDTNIHSVRIEISDIKGNSSQLDFSIQYSRDLAEAMRTSDHASYPPNYINVFEQNDFEAYLPEYTLYDSILPHFNRVSNQELNAASALFQFQDASVPLDEGINVRIKPDLKIPGEFRDKIVIKWTDKKSTRYRRAEWQKDPLGMGWLAAKFNDFGFYQAFIDTVPPAINDLGSGDTLDLSGLTSIEFHPKDNTGVKSFRAELDNQWLMFSNDKGAAWIYNFDGHCPDGVHRLRVKVQDIVGNYTERTWWFRRHQNVVAKNRKQQSTKPATKAKAKPVAKKKRK